jgi:hypothetical protein
MGGAGAEPRNHKKPVLYVPDTNHSRSKWLLIEWSSGNAKSSSFFELKTLTTLLVLTLVAGRYQAICATSNNFSMLGKVLTTWVTL